MAGHTITFGRSDVLGGPSWTHAQVELLAYPAMAYDIIQWGARGAMWGRGKVLPTFVSGESRCNHSEAVTSQMGAARACGG
jgi:hypothetical protein